MKKTAQAPSNIAFIKYWGKADDTLRLPLNSSFSMNLHNTCTTTTVEFSPAYTHDDVHLVGGTFSPDEKNRIIGGIDRIRNRVGGKHLFARIVTKNTFPKGTGAAASASGFAALTVAGFAALGLSLTEKELTIFARMGSGSACRSIPDGFVVWDKGNSSETSFAYSLYPHDYWDLCDLLVIVDATMKKVPTTVGQRGIKSSPYWKERIDKIPGKMNQIRTIFEEKNFQALGTLIEEDCLSMHRVMQTQNPPLYYFNDATKHIMAEVMKWREEGIPVYFTIDAGPNVHLICEKKTVQSVQKKVVEMDEVTNCIINFAATGTHLIDTHLF